jgi:hypothetical protein
MAMVFCRYCGKEINEPTHICQYCETLQVGKINREDSAIPDGIKGWSWGAFILSGIWAIGNRTWIGLLSFIPLVGFIMSIILGIKGREWAWRNKKWKSIEHFNSVQKKWSFWGVLFVFAALALNIASAFLAIPAYQDYIQQAKQQHELNQNYK